MCFSPKMKVPKPQAESLKAPEPVNLEPPKGVEMGDGADDQVDNAPVKGGRESLTIAKSDGSTAAVASDTGATVKKSNPAVKRALKRTS